MLKTGLVGVGKMGISHLAIANAHPDMSVVAVCDNQSFVLSGLKSLVDIATFKSADKMFDEVDLDCVFVATPTATHHDIAAAALQRGIAVFAEKPLTLSASESSGLASLAGAKGVANQVGYHNRFIGTFQEVARLVRSGAIGTVHHVDGRAFGQVVTEPRGGGMTWRSKRSEGGGCLHDYACHVIDLMNFVTGPPAEVLAAQLTSIHSTDVEDAVHALFRYADGATGSLETNWSDQSVRKMSTTITVYGNLGKITADRQECRVYLSPGHSFENYPSGWTIRYITELQAPVSFYLRGEEYSSQIDSFATAVRAGHDRCENSFHSAAAADQVVEDISRVSGGERVHASATGATNIAHADLPVGVQLRTLAQTLRGQALDTYARWKNR